MNKIVFLFALMLTTYIGVAQQTDFEKDVIKLLSVNGSAAGYDMAYDQMVAQFKMMKPNVPDIIWESARKEVFNKEVIELQKQLVPLYQKNFTAAEVKELIKFYESPLGKKLTDGTAKINKETLQIAQVWGMGLSGKLNTYLAGKGM